MSELMLVNPRRRRRASSRKRKTHHRRKGTVRTRTYRSTRHRRRHKRNPSFSMNSFVKRDLMPAVAVAAGGFAYDYAWDKFEFLKKARNSEYKHAYKVGGALAVSIGINMMSKGEMTRNISTGVIAISLFTVVKDMMLERQMEAALTSEGTEKETEGTDGLGVYMQRKKMNRVGEYVTPRRTIPSHMSSMGAPSEYPTLPNSMFSMNY